MFLITALLMLLVGLSAVSADEVTTTDTTDVEEPTVTTGAVSTEQTSNIDNTIATAVGAGGDIDEGTTSVSAEPITAVAGEKFNFTANVARNIPGTRISEGQVEFTTQGVLPANVQAKVKDGIATVEYTAPEKWVGKTIPYTAKYLGSINFMPSEDSSNITVVREQFDTTTTMTKVVGEFDQPITLTTNVILSTGDPVTGGQVYFTTTAGYIGDDSTSIKYVDVVDGVAKYETTAQKSWMTDSDVNTIEATYTGTPDFLESESNPVPLSLFDKVYQTTTTMDPVRALSGQKITLSTKVDIDEKDIVGPVEDGFVYFVVDDATNLTDSDGNVLYAYVDNGKASVETIADSSWVNTEDSTIKAVYEGVGKYLDSESEPVALDVYDYFINTTAQMEKVSGIYGKQITLNAYIEDEDGNPVNDGTVSFLINNRVYIDDADHGQDILYIKPVDGVATTQVIAEKSWDDDSDLLYIQAIYEGDGHYQNTKSEPAALNLYNNALKTTVKMEPVYGVYGELVTLTANVEDENGNPVDEGDVSFLINSAKYIDDGDHGQDILYIKPVDGVATTQVIAEKSWDDDSDLLYIRQYMKEKEYILTVTVHLQACIYLINLLQVQVQLRITK